MSNHLNKEREKAEKLLSTGNPREAVKVLENIWHHAENRMVEVGNLLLYCYRHGGNDPEMRGKTEEIISRAIEIDGNNDLTRFHIAILRKEERKFEEAASILSTLHEKHPENPAFLIQLGECYKQMKDYEKANEYFEKAKAFSPDPKIASLRQLDILVELGDFDSLPAALEKEIHISSNYNLLIEDFFHSLYEDERVSHEKLKELFSNITSKIVVLDRIFFNHGVFLLKNKEYDDCLRMFDKVLELNRQNIRLPLTLMAVVNKILTLERQGFYEKAIVVLKDARSKLTDQNILRNLDKKYKELKQKTKIQILNILREEGSPPPHGSVMERDRSPERREEPKPAAAHASMRTTIQPKNEPQGTKTKHGQFQVRPLFPRPGTQQQQQKAPLANSLVTMTSDLSQKESDGNRRILKPEQKGDVEGVEKDKKPDTKKELAPLKVGPSTSTAKRIENVYLKKDEPFLKTPPQRQIEALQPRQQPQLQKKPDDLRLSNVIKTGGSQIPRLPEVQQKKNITNESRLIIRDVPDMKGQVQQTNQKEKAHSLESMDPKEGLSTPSDKNKDKSKEKEATTVKEAQSTEKLTSLENLEQPQQKGVSQDEGKKVDDIKTEKIGMSIEVLPSEKGQQPVPEEKKEVTEKKSLEEPQLQKGNDSKSVGQTRVEPVEQKAQTVVKDHEPAPKEVDQAKPPFQIETSVHKDQSSVQKQVATNPVIVEGQPAQMTKKEEITPVKNPETATKVIPPVDIKAEEKKGIVEKKTAEESEKQKIKLAEPKAIEQPIVKPIEPPKQLTTVEEVSTLKPAEVPKEQKQKEEVNVESKTVSQPVAHKENNDEHKATTNTIKPDPQIKQEPEVSHLLTEAKPRLSIKLNEVPISPMAKEEVNEIKPPTEKLLEPEKPVVQENKKETKQTESIPKKEVINTQTTKPNEPEPSLKKEPQQDIPVEGKIEVKKQTDDSKIIAGDQKQGKPEQISNALRFYNNLLAEKKEDVVAAEKPPGKKLDVPAPPTESTKEAHQKAGQDDKNEAPKVQKQAEVVQSNLPLPQEPVVIRKVEEKLEATTRKENEEKKVESQAVENIVTVETSLPIKAEVNAVKPEVLQESVKKLEDSIIPKMEVEPQINSKEPNKETKEEMIEVGKPREIDQNELKQQQLPASIEVVQAVDSKPLGNLQPSQPTLLEEKLVKANEEDREVKARSKDELDEKPKEKNDQLKEEKVESQMIVQSPQLQVELPLNPVEPEVVAPQKEEAILSEAKEATQPKENEPTIKEEAKKIEESPKDAIIQEKGQEVMIEPEIVAMKEETKVEVMTDNQQQIAEEPVGQTNHNIVDPQQNPEEIEKEDQPAIEAPKEEEKEVQKEILAEIEQDLAKDGQDEPLGQAQEEKEADVAISNDQKEAILTPPADPEALPVEVDQEILPEEVKDKVEVEVREKAEIKEVKEEAEDKAVSEKHLPDQAKDTSKIIVEKEEELSNQKEEEQIVISSEKREMVLLSLNVKHDMDSEPIRTLSKAATPVVVETPAEHHPERSSRFDSKHELSFVTNRSEDDWDKERCLKLISEDDKNFRAHYKLAELYLEDGDLENSKRHMLKIHEVRQDYMTEKVTLALGEIFFNQGNYERALHFYKIHYKIVSNKEEVLLQIAKCHKKMENVDLAVRTYEKLLEINPKLAEAHYKLGNLHFKNHQIKECIPRYESTISLDPDNAIAMLKLSQAFILVGKKENCEDALLHIANILEFDPYNFQAVCCKAKAYEKLGNFVDAIQAAQTACDLPEADDNTLCYLALLHVKNDEVKKAMEIFKKILRNNKNHLEATVELATLYGNQDEFDKAQKFFNHALKIDPRNVVTLMRVGRFHQIVMKDYPNAIEQYLKVIDIEAANYRANFQLGICYATLNDLKKSNHFMREVLRLKPKYAPAWRALGQNELEKQDWKKAIVYLQKALELDANDSEAKLALADCYFGMNEVELAINNYQEVSEVSPSADVFFKLGNVYFMIDNNDSAIENYRKSIEITSTAACQMNLGCSYMKIKAFGLAIESLFNSLEIDPTQARVFYNLGCCYASRDREEAKKHFEKAISLDPENVEFLENTIKFFVLNNDLDNALSYSQIAYGLQPKKMEIVRALAETHEKRGEKSEALIYYKQWADIEPQNKEVEEKLHKLTVN